MPTTTEIEKVKRELKRKSLDQLKIYNPLETPFFTIYDGYTYSVAPRKEGTFLRYIAEKWMREFIDFMINNEEQDSVEKENDKRRKKGWEVMTPQERDQHAIRNKLVTSDPEKRMYYMKLIYKGISEEHGLEVPQPEPYKKDRRPQDEQLLAQLDAEMGIRDVIPDENPVDEVDDAKDELLEKIS